MLDIVASFFVTVVLMLSACSLLIGSRRLMQQSQVQSAAYEAARQELENIRLLKYDNRIATTSASFTIPSNITSEFPNQKMTGSYSIKTYGAATSPPMEQIVVKVSWKRLGVYSATTSFVQLDGLDVQEPGR